MSMRDQGMNSQELAEHAAAAGELFKYTVQPAIEDYRKRLAFLGYNASSIDELIRETLEEVKSKL